MKAVIYKKFGSVDLLQLEEIELAPPSDHEVQVEPVAVSVNPIDGKIRRGELTIMSGKRFPKRTGQDFSGVVRAVGKKVEHLKVGDEVFGCARGMKDGALGELVNVPEKFVSPRPSSISHTTAAALPMVALAAYQALNRVVKIGPGTSLLVNGCAGGFGLVALQMAQKAGATVTGVCSAESAEVAKKYGAGRVIDYRKENITELPDRYDVILDLSGKLPFAQASKLLSSTGSYINVSATPASIIGSTLANPFRRKKHKLLLSKARAADLRAIASQIDDGSLLPPPVRVFPYGQFVDAYRTAESGKVIGKIVIQVQD